MSFRLEINKTSKDLLKQIEKAYRSVKHKQKRKNEKIKDQEEQKKRTLELLKKFDEMEVIHIHRGTSNNQEINLEKKGIYLTHPNSYKRCENCANFTGSSTCSKHKVEVSDNHRCSHFYSYKTLYGGGFSPR